MQSKIRMFNLHNWVFSFLFPICPCMICLKEKYAKNMKSKMNQNNFNMVASVFLGNVWVIWCTSKVMVPIKQLWLCVGVIDLLISLLFIIWITYAFLQNFHTQHAYILLLLIHMQGQCILTITRNTCGNICLLNYLSLFLKIKLVRLV